MKRIISIILLMLLSVSGCKNVQETSQTEIHDRIVLGFSQLGDESEWRTSSSDDIKRAANEAGVQLIFENAQQDPANQIKAIRSFILNRVDIIAFSPLVEDEKNWNNILLDAKEAGIPVILVDRYINTSMDGLYSAFIGSDFEKEGYEAGRWLLKKFKHTQEQVKIIEISGTEDSSPAIGRHEGFLNVINDYPNFEIVASVSGDFMRSKGVEVMENLLKENNDFDVIFSHNDDMALGAIEVLEEHGIKPGKDVVIISVDAQKSGLNALKEGKLNCLIECSPYIGDQLMELVQKISDGEEIPFITYTKVKVYTEDDDFEALPERT